MKDDMIFVKYIQESIEKIKEFTKNQTEEDFNKSVIVQDAFIRRLEIIIGEEAKNISSEFKNKHSEIPWSEMAKTRDKLTHGYFGIDLSFSKGVNK